MHNVCKLLFLVITLLLIFVIIFQQSNGKDITSISDNTTINFLSENIRGNGIIYITAILAMLFFFISLVLCHISFYEIHDLII